MGSRADAAVAAPVPAGGDLRGARGHRPRRRARVYAKSSATCCSRSSFSRACRRSRASSRWRMRSTRSPPKLIRRHPHVFGSDRPAVSADEVLNRWEDLKRAGARRVGIRSRAARSTVCRERCRDCCAPTNTAAARPRAASTGSRPPTSCSKIEEEIAEVREALAATGGTKRRAARRPRSRKRWATCSLRSPTCRASWASNPRPHCAAPTTSSRGVSPSSSGASPIAATR